MKRERFLALLVATTLAFPITLFGQSRSRQRVVVGGISLREAEEPYRKPIQSALFRAFSDDGRVLLASQKSVAGWWKREQRATEEPHSLEDLQEARELLVDGKKAYQHLDFKQAEKFLVEARREFIRKLHLLRSNRDLLDAHLYLGMTYIALKDQKRGLAEFRRVVYLDPKRELSGREFSPPVLEAFGKAKQEVNASAPARVTILSTPPAADIFLNGRLLGKTPFKTRLAPGEYFLLMEKKGNTPWYKPVLVEKRTREIRAVLQSDRVVKKWGSLFRVREGVGQQSGDLKRIQEMAGSVGADFVFFGTVERMRDYRILGQLYDARTSTFSKVAVAAAGTEVESIPTVFPDLVGTLLSFIGPDGRLIGAPSGADLSVPPEGLTVGQANRPKKPIMQVTAKKPKVWYQRWWIYPLIAAAGVGIYYGATQLGGSSGSSVVIDNEGNY